MQAVLRNKTAKYTKIKHLWERTTNTVVLFLFVAWEQRKLGEISNTTIGEFVIRTKQNPNGEYPVYNGGITYTGFYDDYNNEANKIIVSARGANAGFVNIVKQRYWAGNSCYSIEITAKKAFNIDYVYHFMKCNQHKFIDNQQAANIPSVSKSDVERFDIIAPLCKEQEKLAIFLGQLDNLITLHQRKHFYQKYEKNMVFDCKKTANDWEQRELGELVERVVRKNENNESSLPLTISAQYGLVDQITYFNNRVASRDVSKYYLVYKGEFAYNKSTSDGYPYGAVKRLDLYEKGVLSTLYIVFSTKKAKTVSSDFLCVYFDTDRWHRGVAERAAEGARNHGLLNISAEDFFNIELKLPLKESEQHKIGKMLFELDNLITLHQCKHFLLRANIVMLTDECKRLNMTNDWEQRKVGELLVERNEQAPKSDEYPLMAFIANEGVAPKGERYDRSSLVNDTEGKNYKKTEYGDFIYSSNNLETGSIGLNKYGKASISPVYSIFQPTNLADADFLGRRLVRKDFINSMVKWRQGVVYGQWRIHESDFIKIEIFAPEVEEQKQIGKLLDELDNLITLHQRKWQIKMHTKLQLEKYEKKGKGANDWEQRKLGESVQITMGQSPDGSTYSDEPSDYILVQGNADLQNGWVKPRVWTTQITKKAYAGDLIMSVRAPAGAMGKTAYNAVIGRGVAAIRGNEFVFQSLVKMDLEGFWKKLSCGSTFESLNSDTIANAEIYFPSQDEQKAIGELLLGIDNLITLHQCKGRNKNSHERERIEMEKNINPTNDWEQRELWTITTWDKKFNEVEKEKQPRVIKYPYVLAEVFSKIEDDSGDVRLLSTGTYIGYTTEEKAGANLCEGEIVAIPWGGTPNIKYFKGKFVTADNRIAVSNDTNILKNSHIALWMQSHLKLLESLYRGASIKHPSMSDVLNLVISYPKAEEQTKISDLMFEIDNLITLHRCKDFCKKSNILTSGEKLSMPQKTNAWEQRELGECFDEREERSSEGELISVTMNEGIKKFNELGRHDNSSEDKSHYKKVEIGDIAYNSMRMWQGASGYSPYSGILSPAYTVLVPKIEMNSRYFSYVFKRPLMIHKFQISSQGITSDTWNLKYPALSKINCYTPKRAEQEKIAKIFLQLDNLITLHQRGNQYIQENKK